MRELDAMRRCCNPPPFKPDDFTSNEAKTSPFHRSGEGEGEGLPLSKAKEPSLGKAKGEDARGGERREDSPLPNEPNSRPLGFLAIAKPQSPPNETG